MKTIYEHSLGGDGGKAGAYIEGTDLAIKATYPLAKVLDPVNKVVDSVIDKLEQWIPGDQKELADKLKLEAHAELVQLLSEKPA